MMHIYEGLKHGKRSLTFKGNAPNFIHYYYQCGVSWVSVL